MSKRLVIFNETPYPGRVDTFLSDPKVRALMLAHGVSVEETWYSEAAVERIHDDYGYEMMGEDV